MTYTILIYETRDDSYQPYWALKAHLLRVLGRTDEARDAYASAIGLSEDPAVREFLSGQARN